jgi:hypothetical protein
MIQEVDKKACVDGADKVRERLIEQKQTVAKVAFYSGTV